MVKLTYIFTTLHKDYEKVKKKKNQKNYTLVATAHITFLWKCSAETCW